jgi:tRNA pseudouridine13 synthase
MPNDEVAKLKSQKHPFKMISGDIMEHYPHGRLFDFDGSADDLQRFLDRTISVTGVLCGDKVKLSSGIAGTIEKDFNDKINADGARRYAWVYPTEVEGRFNQIEAQYEMNFTLPKGSYATVLIEEIAKRKIKE